MSKPVRCPKCGHEIKVSRGWFGGVGGVESGGMRMMPGNAVLRCPKCKHVFPLPKDAPLSAKPTYMLVIGVVVALVLALLLAALIGFGR